jgi:hypothetical protein
VSSNIFVFIAILNFKTHRDHREPFQRSRVVAEPQKCQDLLKKNVPDTSELCVQVQCRDAKSTRDFPFL